MVVIYGGCSSHRNADGCGYSMSCYNLEGQIMENQNEKGYFLGIVGH